jgi:hypothetical protein
MKKTSIIIALSIFIMAGCAQKADSIKASYVSPIAYEKLSCKKLEEEVIRVNTRLSKISEEQVETANKDAVVVGVGVVVFWPALLLLAAGEDQKNEIANLKGQYDTIRKVAAKKGCQFAASMR